MGDIAVKIVSYSWEMRSGRDGQLRCQTRRPAKVERGIFGEDRNGHDEAVILEVYSIWHCCSLLLKSDCPVARTNAVL